MIEPAAAGTRAARGAALRPALLLLAVAAASFATYQLAPPAVAGRVIYLYAACLALGPSLVYPLARRRGATPGRALAGSLLVPCAWILKEGWRVSAVFSAPEAAYYALNPMALGLYQAVALQVALIELGLRRPWRRGWAAARGPLAALAAVLLFAAGLGWVGRGSGGSEIFYRYSEIHGWLFAE